MKKSQDLSLETPPLTCKFKNTPKIKLQLRFCIANDIYVPRMMTLTSNSFPKGLPDLTKIVHWKHVSVTIGFIL